jgi:peptide/nickel transport system permease protein
VTTYLLRRLAILLLTLLAASLVVFIVLQVLPGDPAALMLGTGAREDTLAALRARLGLDAPLPLRYLRWAGGILLGDFGVSYTYGVPVADLIRQRVAVSLPLAAMAIVLSTAIAIPTGVWAASRRGRASDAAAMGVAQIGVALPNFWLGILLVLAFAVKLPWFPASGFPGWAAGPRAALAALMMEHAPDASGTRIEQALKSESELISGAATILDPFSSNKGEV